MRTTRFLLLFLPTSLGLALLTGLLASLSPASVAAALTSDASKLITNLDPPLSILASPLSPLSSWSIECADCPHQFVESTDRMLRLDSQGLPHLAYGRDHLYYAWYDGAEWHGEIADPAPYVGTHASLTLDEAGNPSISYFDALNRTLKYAHRDGTGWLVEAVDPDAGDGGTSLGLDSSGYAHIAYWDAVSNTLKVAYQGASGWVFEHPDATSLVGQHSSLAIDEFGNTHIAYSGEIDSSIRYAYRSSGGWITETAATGGNYGEHLSISVDANERPHISLLDGWPAYDLKYTYRDTASWQPVQIVDSLINAGSFNSIAVDGSDNPHISYWADNALRYASLDGSGWHTATVDANGAVGLYSSLALDINGQARIAYYDTTQGLTGYKIKFANQTGGSWEFQAVDTAGSVGADTSLALDQQGFAHISYRDNTWLDLKYASQDASGWHYQTVNSLGDIGLYTSLALDSSGYPHVAYYDSTNQDLKYAFQDAGGWHIRAVDQAGNVGTSLSLALDAQEEAHISYYSVTEHDLRYAHTSAGDWITETVDSAGDVGQYNSLAMDAAGNPHISYFNSSLDDLVHATLSSGVWITGTVDDQAALARGSSIAIHPGGVTAIAYYVSNGGDLRYAEWISPSWSIQTADGAGDTGGNPSLVLDAAGEPHVAYTGSLCPGPCGSLMYASRGISGWVTETVDSSNYDTGLNASLALLGAGSQGGVSPRISYFDALLGDLLYASTPVGIAGLSLTGPPTGAPNHVYTFTASASPPTATLPVTTQWAATGQAPLILINGFTQSVTYTWTTTGVKLITVTAQNPVNWVTATHSITITEIPIEGLSASNDSPTLLGFPTTFTASWTAGTNPQFTWDFGDSLMGMGAVISHTYAAPGVYTVTVTATNSAGSQQATTVASVITQPVTSWLYLPLVLESGP